MFLRTRVVNEKEFEAAFRETGGVYFILDRHQDAIKVGHSRDPVRRLSELQVGCATKLELIGVIAAAREIEPIIHRQLYEGRMSGEWFLDRGVTTEWLMSMTNDLPLYRNVWTLVEGQHVFHSWDENTKSHTRHVWNQLQRAWHPPLPQYPR